MSLHQPTTTKGVYSHETKSVDQILQMRLEMNYREKNVKKTNTWRLNNTLLNNQEITEEIKEEIKKYLETT